MLVARAVRGVELEAAQRFRAEVADPLIREIAGRLASFDPRGQDVTPDNFPELQAMIREAEAIVERGVENVRRLAEERMQDIAKSESEFVAENAKKTLDEPVQEAQPVNVQGRPFLGDKAERWFRKMLTGPTSDAVRQRITQGIQQGMTVDQIVRSIRGTRGQQGILDASSQSVATLVRTASTSASSNARGESFKALGITHWRFLATLDSRTSVICAAHDGKRFPVGEGPMPPLHPNCFPGDTLVSSSYGVASVTKRRFDGEVVVIRTASGRVLTATPNHPILTGAGWVGIGLVRVGDNVVRDLSGKWGAAVDSDGQDAPATFHDVAEAFFASSGVATVPVPVSAPDFHGDAADGDVAVVGANRSLLVERYAAVAEHAYQSGLVGADVLSSASGSLNQLGRPSLAPSDGLMGGVGHGTALGGGHSGDARDLLIAAIPGLAPVLGQDPGDDVGRGAPKVVCNASHADAVVEHGNRGSLIDDSCADGSCGAHTGTATAQESVDLRAADARLADEILDGGTGLIGLDEIVDVHREWFSGDVFNMETGRGFYTAGGLIVHNCRSTAVPDFGGKAAGTRASIDGQVSADKDFGAWLASRSITEQNEVLGVAKAKAWRTGQLSLKQMLGRDLQPLTLAELRRLDRI